MSKKDDKGSKDESSSMELLASSDLESSSSSHEDDEVSDKASSSEDIAPTKAPKNGTMPIPSPTFALALRRCSQLHVVTTRLSHSLSAFRPRLFIPLFQC